MLVKRVFEDGLAQASYLIGCASAHRAIVIDPNRDVHAYVEAAAAEGLQITDVTETHIHADFVSGSRELAALTGATLHLSDEGDADWKYDFASEAHLVRNGDRIDVGRVAIDVVHTPGHTPEHLTFVITDTAVATQPIAAATGDFVFVGDVGRPDLLERAVHVKDSMTGAARSLYRSLRTFDGSHEDWLQIWPGHGAGSSCGKGISAVPHTTLGYERRFNWAFAAADEDAFVAAVPCGQPDPPSYFATMKRVNKAGPAPVGPLAPLARVTPARAIELAASGGLVVDTRPAEAFAAAHLSGTVNIPFNRAFTTWCGWLVPYDRPFAVICEDVDGERARRIRRALALIGLDNVEGAVSPDELAAAPELPPLAESGSRQAGDLAAAIAGGACSLLDVRTDAEWQAGHLPGAAHVPLGHLVERLADVPTDKPLVVYCQAGSRAAIAQSLLARAGWRGVTNMAGGYEAWTASGHAVELE